MRVWFVVICLDKCSQQPWLDSGKSALVRSSLVRQLRRRSAASQTQRPSCWYAILPIESQCDAGYELTMLLLWMCGQNMDDPVRRAGLQVKFIDVILIPWWDKVSGFFPGLKHCYLRLQQNRDFYAQLAGQEPRRASSVSKKPPPNHQPEQKDNFPTPLSLSRSHTS